MYVQYINEYSNDTKGICINDMFPYDFLLNFLNTNPKRKLLLKCSKKKEIHFKLNRKMKTYLLFCTYEIYIKFFNYN